MNSNHANRVELHIVYKAIPREKLEKAWTEGFHANLSASSQAALENSIETFNALFHSVSKGDVIAIDFLPGLGT